MNISNKAIITGISELKPLKEAGGKRTLDLLAESALLALEDANLEKGEIDGLIVTPPTEDSYFMWPSQVAEYLQLSPNFLDMIELGGASAAASVARAVLMIDAGICNNCLCLSGGVWDSQVFNSLDGKKAVMSQAEIDHELPYGPMGFNSAYAMITRRHMCEYGTRSEQLAKIPVAQRVNALLNPNALYNDKKITVEDVLSSPLIVDPIHLLEIVRPCSGAAAVIVSKQPNNKSRTSVSILGFGESYTHNSIVYAPSITDSPVKFAAAKAFSMANLLPQDINFVSIYDCYPIAVLITLEDAGFCPKGEGGNFLENNDLTYNGNLPCNTHGGQLSFGQASFAGGMSHIIEAVRQLRGEAGKRQVKNNNLAFINGNGGVLSTQCSLIMGRV
ncbi:Acetyl-CoA C-acyltransferase [Candidatus Syntrophocurvum alkaliphilum]|uniref:Acetyl-CoA C-acyltransferase n=1 Tax=Candidatus Syntrophocurvum alkaliphilum TaxID=2293317 RepID=A0A6I6DGJ6_9FIRM|nr:thiolase family protein [Candidatus Syntrophocurvum alkaliphilum]QGT99463.1 Acetyl-CoA C-acyltransferase [Candidatus Syntrophocurvum alkaliphilum]